MKEQIRWTKVPKRKRSEWQKDEKCYFLIRPNMKKKLIEIRAMSYDKKVLGDYCGKDPEDVYYKILQDNLVTKLQHAAYLGSELQKVHNAIKFKLKYVQDSELTKP